MLDKIAQKVGGKAGAIAVMASVVAGLGLAGGNERNARNKIESATAMGTRGQSATRAVSLIVGILVAAILAANLLPTAIDQVNNVDTSSWDSSTAAIWGIMGVLIVLGPVLYFVGVATDSI